MTAGCPHGCCVLRAHHSHLSMDDQLSASSTTTSLWTPGDFSFASLPTGFNLQKISRLSPSAKEFFCQVSFTLLLYFTAWLHRCTPQWKKKWLPLPLLLCSLMNTCSYTNLFSLLCLCQRKRQFQFTKKLSPISHKGPKKKTEIYFIVTNLAMSSPTVLLWSTMSSYMKKL